MVKKTKITQKNKEALLKKLGQASRLLANAAVDLGYTVEVFDGVLSVFRVKNGRKSVLFNGFQPPANSLAASKIADNKYLTSTILADAGIPVPKSLRLKRKDFLTGGWDISELKKPLVVKPLRGTVKGRGVITNIRTKRDAIKYLKVGFKKHSSMLVEEFHGGMKDYRVLVVGNKVVAVLERVPAYVTGDGKKNIRKLIHEKNELRKEGSNAVKRGMILVDAELKNDKIDKIDKKCEMDIQKQLESIGLHQNEAKIYAFLLQHGLSTPPQIAKGTGIARTNTYNILQSLAAQRLVTAQMRGKRKAYVANDPESLFRQVEQRKERIEEALPDLRAAYATHQSKPIIRFFDGFEEVKEIYYMTLSAKEVHAIGSTNELERQGQDFYDGWLAKVKEKNIVFYDILSHASGERAAPQMKEMLRGLYDYTLMPSKYEDFPTDMLIWDDNIALLTLEEPIFGTVITSPPLARTFRILFAALQEGLQR